MSEQNKTEVVFLHKYELRESNEIKDVKILWKDGNPCKCHKAGNPMIVPSMLSNELNMKYEFCSTNCPRALIGLEGDKLMYFQTCEVQTMKFKIENVDVKKSPLEIIK